MHSKKDARNKWNGERGFNGTGSTDPPTILCREACVGLLAAAESSPRPAAIAHQRGEDVHVQLVLPPGDHGSVSPH